MSSFLDQQRLNRVTPTIVAGETDHHSWNRDYKVGRVSITLMPHQTYLVTTVLGHNTQPDRYLYEVSLYRTMPDGVTIRERGLSDEPTLFQINADEVI